MISPSICQSHIPFVCHTANTTCPSVCQSHDLSFCHTANMTSLSVCQTYNSSVFHTVILTSPSICQVHDSSACQPNCDVTKNTICKAVCLSSVLSVLLSAKLMLKMPTSISLQKFLNMQYLGNSFPPVHQWIHLSIHQSVHPPPCHCLLKNHQNSLVIMGIIMW